MFPSPTLVKKVNCNPPVTKNTERDSEEGLIARNRQKEPLIMEGNSERNQNYSAALDVPVLAKWQANGQVLHFTSYI